MVEQEAVPIGLRSDYILGVVIEYAISAIKGIQEPAWACDPVGFIPRNHVATESRCERRAETAYTHRTAQIEFFVRVGHIVELVSGYPNPGVYAVIRWIAGKRWAYYLHAQCRAIPENVVCNDDIGHFCRETCPAFDAELNYRPFCIAAGESIVMDCDPRQGTYRQA